MASNDMEVIMYKILKYLYECMKNDKEPKLEEFAWDSKIMNVPKNYWLEVIAVLTEKEFIKGFFVMCNKTKDTELHVQTDPPYKITYEGVCFLDENSGMKKAKEFCKDSFNVLLSAVIGVII